MYLYLLNAHTCKSLIAYYILLLLLLLLFRCTTTSSGYQIVSLHGNRARNPGGGIVSFAIVIDDKTRDH